MLLVYGILVFSSSSNCMVLRIVGRRGVQKQVLARVLIYKLDDNNYGKL